MVNTTHPGNIGAAARAIKNMGLSRLVLVSPKEYPSLEAVSRAAGALDVMDKVQVVETLDEAIAGCIWVAGTSARLRTVEWSVLGPRACVAQGVDRAEQGDIAIVFGRENNGLTNEELEKCNVLLHIPTNPEYSSLNIAASIQVICYEVRQLVYGEEVVQFKGRKHMQDVPASADQLDGMYQHLNKALDDLNFFGTNNPDVMMRRLKSLFNRADITQREVNIIRGICSTILDRKDKD